MNSTSLTKELDNQSKEWENGTMSGTTSTRSGTTDTRSRTTDARSRTTGARNQTTRSNASDYRAQGAKQPAQGTENLNQKQRPGENEYANKDTERTMKAKKEDEFTPFTNFLGFEEFSYQVSLSMTANLIYFLYIKICDCLCKQMVTKKQYANNPNYRLFITNEDNSKLFIFY